MTSYVASDEAFLAKILIIKVFPCRVEHIYVPIFRGLDARGGRKLRTDTHTHIHTHETTTVTLVVRIKAEG